MRSQGVSSKLPGCSSAGIGPWLSAVKGGEKAMGGESSTLSSELLVRPAALQGSQALGGEDQWEEDPQVNCPFLFLCSRQVSSHVDEACSVSAEKTLHLGFFFHSAAQNLPLFWKK